MYPEGHPHPRRRRLTRRRLGVDVLVPADARVDVLVSEVARVDVLVSEVARVDVLVPGVTGMAERISRHGRHPCYRAEGCAALRAVNAACPLSQNGYD